jgi:alpha-tubulin suppressor-like RCC1 family protein
MPTRIIQRTPDLGFTIKMKRIQPEPEAAEVEPIKRQAKTRYYEGTGYRVTAYIKQDGTLWAMGWIPLGPSNSDFEYSRVRKQIGTDTDWEYVEGNAADTVYHLIKKDGSLWAWGTNGGFDGWGYLGGGPLLNVAAPLPVMIDEGPWVRAYYDREGGGGGMGIKADGTLWRWAFVKCKQTDNTGISIEDIEPNMVQIGTDTDWKDFWVHYPTIVEKQDGTLWGMNRSNEGQLGNGIATDYWHCVPILLSFPGNVPRA